MKTLFLLLAFCIFAGCATSHKKAVAEGFEYCKKICTSASAVQINTICFEKDREEPICMCAEK